MDEQLWEDLPVGWALCQYWHRASTPQLRVVLAVLTLETAGREATFVSAVDLEVRWGTGLDLPDLLTQLAAVPSVLRLRGDRPTFTMSVPEVMAGREPPSPGLLADVAAISGIEVQDPPLACGEVSVWARLGRMARRAGDDVLAGRAPVVVLADLPVDRLVGG